MPGPSSTGQRKLICLLAEEVKELREEVKWYLSFSDEEVFQGVVLPEKEEDQKPKTLSAKSPYVPESTKERRGPKFLGWEKGLHPFWPEMAAGEIPPTSKTSKPRVGPIQLPQILPVKPPASLPKASSPPEPSSPVQALALVWPPTLLLGFAGVMACLQTPMLVEVSLELPLGTMPIGVVAAPRISTVSMSCIMRDEATGVTYMDTVTTSTGRVGLSGPDPEASSLGPMIEDVTGHE